MPHQETSRYYERCLRQMAQLHDMLPDPSSIYIPSPAVLRRVATLAKIMQEERQHANNS